MSKTNKTYSLETSTVELLDMMRFYGNVGSLSAIIDKLVEQQAREIVSKKHEGYETINTVLKEVDKQISMF